MSSLSGVVCTPAEFPGERYWAHIATVYETRADNVDRKAHTKTPEMPKLTIITIVKTKFSNSESLPKNDCYHMYSLRSPLHNALHVGWSKLNASLH
jgi:hypothetical protein